jgi:hypothetical protein
MLPKVVVATLTWNQKSDVLECLASLTKLDYPNYEIVVVDNGSTDGTFHAIRGAFPQVHIVKHSENLGCAEGVNGEIRYALQAGADYLFIIANDAVVEPSTLKELVLVAEKDPKIGIVSPKVYYYGTDKRIWFARGAKFDWTKGRFFGFAQDVEDDESFDQEEEAEFFPGGFSLVRIEAIKKAGFLDPGYFIYFDDSDWSHRIHQAGYSGRYAPKARVWHKPSSALGKETEGFHYYRTRNRLFFVKQYAPPGVFAIFFLHFLFEFVSQTLPYLYLNRQRPQIKAALLGILDFLRGKRGSREFGPERRGMFRRLIERMILKTDQIRRSIRCNTKKMLGEPLRFRVRVNWNVGDEIMTIPVYEALKRKYPNSVIEAEVRHPELLKNNPFVDGVNLGERSDLDRIIDLHQEARNRPRYEFLAEVSRTGSWNEPKVYLEAEELREVRLRWIRSNETLQIALSASARWFSRQWGRDEWTQLANYFIERHGAEVLVLGKEEEPLPVGVNLIGETNLREAAALLSQCQLFVGSDSGLVHLALAVGTPTVGLFGPLNPTYLISPRPHFVPVWSEMECRGCWSDGRMTHPDHCPKIVPDCMSSIGVERVIRAGETLLAQKSVQPSGALRAS